MPAKALVAAVIVLVVLVGGTFLLIGILEHGDPGDGSNPTKGAPAPGQSRIVRTA